MPRKSTEAPPIFDTNGDLLTFKEVKIFEKGSSFGELALMSNKPRSGTIQCWEDSKFAVLNKANYNKIFMKLDKKKLNDKITFLKCVPFFSKWTNMALSKFWYDFYDTSFIRNKTVFKEGQKADFVYIVKQGEFELTKGKNASDLLILQ